MKELLVRAASGAVFVALVLGAAWLGPWWVAALFLPVTLIGIHEFRKLRGVSQGTAGMMLLGGLAYAVLVLIELLDFSSATLAQAIFHALGLLWFLFRLPMQRGGVANTGGALFYIVAPFAFATWLTAMDTTLFVGTMLLLWTNDTGAYLVGKAIGRHKLMPSVSPGKTWEGLIGGILLALGSGWLIAQAWTALPVHGWLIAAVAISITGTIGDLYESAMKRIAGVKDSGRIMPGHGGVLDRFDGFLLAAPAMLLLTLLIR